MGSRTYYDMAAFWPSSGGLLAAPMNEIPRVVVSRKGLIDTPGAQPTTTALTDAKRAQIGASGTSEPTAPVKGS